MEYTRFEIYLQIWGVMLVAFLSYYGLFKLIFNKDEEQ